MINILVLSAGRRVELINCFKNASKKLKLDSNIITGDMSQTAPATYFSDRKYILPPIKSNEYIDEIVKICKLEDVKLIIPTIDTELLILAQNKDKIENDTNAKVLISSYDVISICRDKIKTYNYFIKNDFLAPRVLCDEDIQKENYKFPLFIKPLNGSSSVNAFKVNNVKELEFFRDYINEPMIQDFICGDEYTIDVFCDFESNIIDITPRIRIATRSGEILKGLICKDNEIIEDVKKLITELKPIGHITVQCMKTQRGIEYIEINPRFGGGAPMSIKAGADSCEYLFRLLCGETLEYQNRAQDKILFTRFDNSIALNEQMEIINV